MKPIAGTRTPGRETQPLAAQAIDKKFVTLYSDTFYEKTDERIRTMLSGRSLPHHHIEGSETAAAQVVEEATAHMGREGHLIVNVHGEILKKGPYGQPKHLLHIGSDAPEGIPTRKFVKMVVDKLGIRPNRIDRPNRGLPFIYLISCRAGAVRQNITPGSALWKSANLLLFSGSQVTGWDTCHTAMQGAVAYVDHCQRAMRRVDPLKLLIFAGAHRGDCITLMGGKLSEPLIWHAPQSPDEGIASRLTGADADLERLENALMSLRRSERDLLPPASLVELLRNRIVRDDGVQVSKLLAAHPELRDTRTVSGFPPVLIAASTRVLSSLRALIMAGADLNQLSEDGYSALHYAISSAKRAPETLNLLLDCGANPNVADPEGITPLMDACYRNNTGAIASLLSHHANVELRERDGNTALTIASLLGHTGAVRQLLAAGAGPSAGLSRELVDAVRAEGHDEIAEVLEQALTGKAAIT